MKIHVDAPALGHLFVEAMGIEVESIIVTPYVTISSRYNSERLVMDLYVGDQAYYDVMDMLSVEALLALEADGITIA